MQRPLAMPAVACFLSLLLAACAAAPKGPAWSEDREYVLDVLQQEELRGKRLQARLDAAEARLATMEARLTKIEGELKALSEEVGRLAAMRPPVPAPAKKRLLARIRRIEKEVHAAAAPRPANSEAVRKAMHAALLELKSGRFEEAARRYRALLAKPLPARLRGEAWYWLGEALFALGRHTEARRAFRMAAVRFARHPKRPDAMLKYAILLREAGKETDARAMLASLAAEFPDTPAAARARELLAEARKPSP